jgi:hypothetical protein
MDQDAPTRLDPQCLEALKHKQPEEAILPEGLANAAGA